MMRYVGSVKRGLRRKLREVVHDEVRGELAAVLPSVLAFAGSQPAQRQSARDHTKDPLGNLAFYAELRRQLIGLGVRVEDREIDIDAFEAWLDAFPEMVRFYSTLGPCESGNALSATSPGTSLVRDQGRPTWMCVCVGSPWTTVLSGRGVDAFSLDLVYEPGLHGDRIGGDAGDPPLPSEFADGLPAQCSFECFMGDADTRFACNVGRLLKPGGRCAVLPLYWRTSTTS